VQELVKKGGATRRRGGRRQWRDDVEAVEASALDDGGTGSSHGRLRSSRRTACPRVASNPSFSPHFSFSSGVQVCGQGVDSPEAARVRRAPGVAAAASYSGGPHGVRGWLRSTRGRGAHHDGETMTGAAALWLWPSAKAIKIGDDDGDVGVTPS
jgi:hypothetical protein